MSWYIFFLATTEHLAENENTQETVNGGETNIVAMEDGSEYTITTKFGEYILLWHLNRAFQSISTKTLIWSIYIHLVMLLGGDNKNRMYQ